MRRSTFARGVSILVTLWLALPTARAAGLQTIPVSRIRRGMGGYGLTVLKGTKPERFHVTVLGVLHNAFPKQDLILILCDDPKLKDFGVAAGMSGSPIYIQGKLAGALAYGPVFAKSPIAMVTPIANMLAELKRPLHGMGGAVPGPLGRAGGASGGAGMFRRALSLFDRRVRNLLSGRDADALDFRRWWGLGPGQPIRGAAALRPLALPLSVSGLDSASIKELGDIWPWRASFVPVQAGSGGSAALARYGRISRFVPGGSIAVELVRGDITAAATGTVTAVVGNKLVAFGHPFMGIGEFYLPAVGAWIHMVVPSIYSSYKMATPLNELGSLLQDRRPCIAAETGRRAPMIPTVMTIVTPDGRRRVYHVDVLAHPALAARYIYLVLRASIRNAASDVGEVFAQVDVRIETDRVGRLSYTDYFATDRGAYYGFWPRISRGIRLLGFLYDNPFARVRISKVEATVRLQYKIRAAEIVAVSTTSPEVEAGSRIGVRVTLKRWRGGRYHITIPVDIPNVPDGTLLRIQARSGSDVIPDHAPPESLRDVLATFRRTFDGRQVVVSLRTAAEAASVEGRLVTDLPGSVVDSLRTAARRKEETVLTKGVLHWKQVPDVVLGAKALYLRVVRPEDDETGEVTD